MNRAEQVRLLPEVSRIAHLAGAAILEVYDKDFEVQSKQDRTPVTDADFASHRVIVNALEALTPEIPVLSEEGAGIPFEERSGWEVYWLVDPLDGTREFINRNGEFTVNIALISNHVPMLGVVQVPVTGSCYSGVIGEGAWLHEAGGESREISVRTPRAHPPVVVGSRSHANPVLKSHLSLLGEYELVSMGSSLKFCLVAEGRADFYPRLGPTSEWDTAAAHAIVNAAGGQLVRLDGSPLEYNRKESLLNPEFLVFGDPSFDWSSLFADYSP